MGTRTFFSMNSGVFTTSLSSLAYLPSLRSLPSRYRLIDSAAFCPWSTGVDGHLWACYDVTTGKNTLHRRLESEDQP